MGILLVAGLFAALAWAGLEHDRANWWRAKAKSNGDALLRALELREEDDNG